MVNARWPKEKSLNSQVERSYPILDRLRYFSNGVKPMRVPICIAKKLAGKVAFASFARQVFNSVLRPLTYWVRR